MAFKIIYKSSVEKDLRRLDKKEAKRILSKIDRELAAKPDKNSALTGEFAGLRKFRIGDYRVVYTLFDEEVMILRIGHRKEVCR